MDAVNPADPEFAKLAQAYAHPVHFCAHFVKIYDASSRSWTAFRPWPAQRETLDKAVTAKRMIALKARQLGFTWMFLSYALWLMLMRPSATVLLFSKRDDEAIELLDFRLKGIYDRLPGYLQCPVLSSDKHVWHLSNGSRALAFPTSAGQSYTGTIALLDEADHMPDLGKLLNAVQPTVDSGGQMFMLSTPDKSKPSSEFKNIYRAAKEGNNGWLPVYYGWQARPGRTPEWYEDRKKDFLAREGSLDSLHQEYSATDLEALAPKSLDKRIPYEWIQQCYSQRDALTGNRVENAPAIPGLAIYAAVKGGKRYIIGADPAEGNPTSDESSIDVLDEDNGEQVACLAGRIQPDIFASYISAISVYYNRAPVMVERNNHGHAVILWLKDNSKVQLLVGLDRKPGWQTSSKSKAMIYADTAEAFRDQNVHIHSFESMIQLQSIEGSTLSAPEGLADDRAMSLCLATAGMLQVSRRTTPPSTIIVGVHGVTPDWNSERNRY